MRVLVVHASQFGATRAIAERLGASLRAAGCHVEVSPVTEVATLVGADAVVIGSAVHASHWLDDATRFVYRHQDALKAVPVWLFSSGPLGDRAAAAPQPDPKEVAAFRLLVHPRDHRVFAGAYDRDTADFSRSGLIERTLVSRLMPSGDWRDWDAIDAWGREIARALLGAAAQEPVPAPA